MEAQSKFERLLNLLKFDSTNLALRRDCVDAAVEVRDYDSAVAVAEVGLLQSPQDDRLLSGKGNALIGRGEYQSAIGILELLQGLHPENRAIAQNLALCHYCIGNYSEARNSLEAIYADGERNPGAIRMLVSSCHHLGLMDRAITVADQNKELAQTDSALAGAYALVYLDHNRAADAAQCAAYSLQANPRCIDALTVDATLHLDAGDIDTAKREFEEILSVNPNLGRAWIGLGSMAIMRRDFDQAKSDLTRGVESMPKHVNSWHMLGWTHLMASEIDEAERAFSRALELNHDFAETHGALAVIACMRDQSDKAGEMINVALRMDPECLAAQFARSILVGNAGDVDGSLKLIGDTMDKLARVDPASMRRLMSVAISGQEEKE